MAFIKTAISYQLSAISRCGHDRGKRGMSMHNLPIGDRPAPETADDLGETPRHGFQGDRGRETPPRTVPAGLTIALSREAGARGGSIARRTGRLLGWQVYDQELLEYMAQDATVRQGVVENLSRPIAEWVEARLHRSEEHT